MEAFRFFFFSMEVVRFFSPSFGRVEECGVEVGGSEEGDGEEEEEEGEESFGLIF